MCVSVNVCSPTCVCMCVSVCCVRPLPYSFVLFCFVLFCLFWVYLWDGGSLRNQHVMGFVSLCWCIRSDSIRSVPLIRSLSQVLSQHRAGFKTTHVKHIAYQMLLGLGVVHASHIIHRVRARACVRAPTRQGGRTLRAED